MHRRRRFRYAFCGQSALLLRAISLFEDIYENMMDAINASFCKKRSTLSMRRCADSSYAL